MTINLPPDIETRVMGEARRRGVDAPEYVRQLIETALPKPVTDQATLELLDRWEAETATDDPDELARRRQEFEEFKAAMNRNRLEMEGPHARKLFP